MKQTETDILVVGGGMAGMSLAAALSGHARVLLIEQEDQPGYHATGRSVAFWMESYGGPGVQPLTSASRDLLAEPDRDFSREPFLGPRGAIHVGRAEDTPLAEAMWAHFAGSGVVLEPLLPEDLHGALPGLRPDWQIGISEPSCRDIDVAGLFQAFRGEAQRNGVEISPATRLVSARREGGSWLVESDRGAIRAARIVNAAGAWADPVAQACGLDGLGVTPLRRTVVQLRAAGAPDDFPLVVDLSGNFYFKPAGAGRIWLSPHDETPDRPRDVAPEELDVAIAIDRFEQVVDWRVEAVERKWAGLRSFAPDRMPVYGFDPRAEGFFWFAGQGGFGIQTAPAAALLGSAILLGQPLPDAIARVDPGLYAPDRLVKRRSQA